MHSQCHYKYVPPQQYVRFRQMAMLLPKPVAALLRCFYVHVVSDVLLCKYAPPRQYVMSGQTATQPSLWPHC